jgi:predicted acylesterase/phospholipase RssA
VRARRLLLALLVALCLINRPGLGQTKPFHRVLVLTGGGFKFLYEIGVYDALVDHGWKPDLIIATCGGAVAAAIIHGVPDRNERLALIQSPELLNGFRAFRLTGGGFRDLERLIRKLSHYKTGWETGSDVIPDLFSLTLFDNDSIALPFWQRPFSARSPDDPHVLIVGATLAFGPKDVGASRNGRKLYHEAYFTDAEVAPYLEGFPSPIAQDYPESAVGPETFVFTQFTVGDAASISIRDPFLMKPVEYDGQYYAGGDVDLFPLELARRLGTQVVMTFNPGFWGHEILGVGVTLGYDLNVRLRKVGHSEVDHWIDATRLGAGEFTLDPRLKRGFPSLFQLKDGLPRDQLLPFSRNSGNEKQQGHYVLTAEMEFMRRSLVAYDKGYDRGVEAITEPAPGSTGRIRDKNGRNYYGSERGGAW